MLGAEKTNFYWQNIKQHGIVEPIENVQIPIKWNVKENNCGKYHKETRATK